MLDTNIASDLIRSSRYDKRMLDQQPARFTISCITEAELLYGISKKPDATKLHYAVSAFLRTVDICQFDSAVANAYGELRCNYESKGLSIGNLDALIAAHALSLGLTLITRDGVLLKLKPWLKIQKW